jgi:hypothetical protein
MGLLCGIKSGVFKKSEFRDVQKFKKMAMF